MTSIAYAQVPSLQAPLIEDFRRAQAAARPVVISGALARWPALGRWSPEDFRARFGDTQIDAYEMERNSIALDPKLGFRVTRLAMRDYCDLVAGEGPARLYLRMRLPGVLPELAAEVDAPTYCADGLLLRENLWFGAAQTVSHLHFDLPYNLIAQVHGQKRFILFAPGEARNLYRHSWISSTPHLARVDPEHPDYARFPRLRDAHGYECTLEPGDLLFLPSRWWHYARALTTTISVNFWWVDRLLYPLVRLSDTYKKARGLNI